MSLRTKQEDGTIDSKSKNLMVDDFVKFLEEDADIDKPKTVKYDKIDLLLSLKKLVSLTFVQ